jgi:hypothetical protein
MARRALLLSAQVSVFGRIAVVSILSSLMLGCSSASGNAPTKAAVTSPTPDSLARNYVELVHNYWSQYKTVEGDLATVCGTPPNGPNVKLVKPSLCRDRSLAILDVHEKFLSDLDSTPPPPKFAADDRAIRSQLPKVIADVKSMISAAGTGNDDAVVQATIAYINDMIPTMTDALDDVDPAVVHN